MIGSPVVCGTIGNNLHEINADNRQKEQAVDDRPECKPIQVKSLSSFEISK